MDKDLKGILRRVTMDHSLLPKTKSAVLSIGSSYSMDLTTEISVRRSLVLGYIVFLGIIDIFVCVYLTVLLCLYLC